jgi:hypothetical protein
LTCTLRDIAVGAQRAIWRDRILNTKLLGLVWSEFCGR